MGLAMGDGGSGAYVDYHGSTFSYLEETETEEGTSDTFSMFQNGNVGMAFGKNYIKAWNPLQKLCLWVAEGKKHPQFGQTLKQAGAELDWVLQGILAL